MPKNFLFHAMGVKRGLRSKRGLSNIIPVRQLKITGEGAQRRLTDSELGTGSKPMRKTLTPLKFKF